MSALHDLTVAQLAAQLRSKEVSAVELAQHFLKRMAAHESLGAFLATDEAVTLAQADGTAWMAFYCSTMLAIASMTVCNRRPQSESSSRSIRSRIAYSMS